jgi:hypothetical protein
VNEAQISGGVANRPVWGVKADCGGHRLIEFWRPAGKGKGAIYAGELAFNGDRHRGISADKQNELTSIRHHQPDHYQHPEAANGGAWTKTGPAATVVGDAVSRLKAGS